MNATNCFFERVSALTIGILLLVGAIGFAVVGLTVLPVVGLVVAVPIFALSVYFFRVHFNRQCEIRT
jgi:uncharacterized membrane protein